MSVPCGQTVLKALAEMIPDSLWLGGVDRKTHSSADHNIPNIAMGEPPVLFPMARVGCGIKIKNGLHCPTRERQSCTHHAGQRKPWKQPPGRSNRFNCSSA